MHTYCPQCKQLNDLTVLVCLCGNNLISPQQPEIDMQPEQQAPPTQFHRETQLIESPTMPEHVPPPDTERLLREKREQAVRRLLLEEEASNAPNARKPSIGTFRLKVKEILVVVSFVAAMGAVLAVWGGFIDITGNSAAEQEKEQAASLANTDLAPDAPRNALKKPVGENIIDGEVTDILSGDTIRILGSDNQEYAVKLEGIDAPEAEQSFGAEAKNNLFGLVFGKKVRLVQRTVGADGMIIGKILLGGVSMNLAQLRSGLAWHDTSTVFDQSENDSFAYTETIARRSKFGLWSDPNPVSPWEYRNKMNQKQAETPLVATQTNNAPNATPNAKIIQRETTRRIQNETTVAQSAPATESQTPPDAISPPSPPKVTALVPEGHERKTTLFSRVATARCTDGTLSFSTTRSGSCARHGGVAVWLGTGTTTTAPAAKTYTRPRNYNLGPRGGCYFINDYGKKVYVDRELCAN